MRDEQGCNDPDEDEVFVLYFQIGKEEEERINIQEVAVGQGSATSAIIRGHQDKVNKDSSGESSKGQPLVEAWPFSQDEENEKEKCREEIPDDSGEPSKKVIENIVEEVQEAIEEVVTPKKKTTKKSTDTPTV